jgi:hypothetical protein
LLANQTIAHPVADLGFEGNPQTHLGDWHFCQRALYLRLISNGHFRLNFTETRLHNQDVAVVHVAFIDDLFFAAGWAKQVAQKDFGIFVPLRKDSILGEPRSNPDVFQIRQNQNRGVAKYNFQRYKRLR